MTLGNQRLGIRIEHHRADDNHHVLRAVILWRGRTLKLIDHP